MESTNSRALLSFWPFLGGGIIQRSIINIATAMFMERDWYLEDCIEKEEIFTSIVLRDKTYNYKI